MTEFFLTYFIIRFSDILLIVVGELTYSEQLLINKIKVESQRQNKGKIFIIHNLKEFITVKQVQDYIKNTLLKCSTFDLTKKTLKLYKKKKKMISTIDDDGEEEDDNDIDEKGKDEPTLGNFYFTENINYDKYRTLRIYHLILANEDSEAGRVYNQYTYNFIESTYNLIYEPKKFDIFEQIKNYFKKLSDIILREDIKYAQFYENEKIIKDKLIKLEYDKI